VPFAHDLGSGLGIAQVAELQEMIGRLRVVEEDLVDVERIQLAATEVFDCRANTLHQHRQLGPVVRRHRPREPLSI
jgi:hypothetical protein